MRTPSFAVLLSFAVSVKGVVEGEGFSGLRCEAVDLDEVRGM